MRRFFRDNGLSIVLFGLFFFSFILGQSLTGQYEHNEDQREHGHPTISYVEYLGSSHFLEATMENWESEFLQMFTFVILTTFLYQKGSAESKDPDKPNPVDRDPAKSKSKKDAPWPVRKGGFILKLYEQSLSLTFLLLFLFAFVLHAVGGASEYNQEQTDHGSGQQVTVLGYMSTSRFWFESFQNWQSEFLAIGAMVVLTIFLRQKGSPESKPVDAPHSKTGSE
ncbi:MAG TPA: DUF6766 family protein [Blastocatellia bacterium]|nr:DUF6766 family protein [Blastocatellia bacterium]